MLKKHSVSFRGYRLHESFRFVPHLPKITATHRPTKCITETFLCAHAFLLPITPAMSTPAMSTPAFLTISVAPTKNYWWTNKRISDSTQRHSGSDRWTRYQHVRFRSVRVFGNLSDNKDLWWLTLMFHASPLTVPAFAGLWQRSLSFIHWRRLTWFSSAKDTRVSFCVHDGAHRTLNGAR